MQEKKKLLSKKKPKPRGYRVTARDHAYRIQKTIGSGKGAKGKPAFPDLPVGRK